MGGQAEHPLGAGYFQFIREQNKQRAHTEQESVVSKSIAIVGPSGASLAVTAAAIIPEISRLGHHVFCFAPKIDEKTEKILARWRAEPHELPVFRQGFSPYGDPRCILRLYQSFRRLRPDIVVGYSPKGAALAGIAGRLAGVDHIVTMLSELGSSFDDGSDTARFSISAPFHRSMLRMAFKLSKTAIFLNEENHRLLYNRRFLPSSLRQFPMNGSGLDLQQFPEAELPALDRGVMFLFAGPLDKRLGIEEYCEAARLLQSKPGNYKCLVVGPEISGTHSFSLADLKRYRNFVQYLGPHADPRPYMSRTHVFVLPARGDAIPHSLIEAIAMGRPVITSTARGCRVAVRNGSNGALVPMGDASALAAAMARLLLRPDLIPSMARASRKLAETQFDSRRISERLIAALDL